MAIGRRIRGDAGRREAKAWSSGMTLAGVWGRVPRSGRARLGCRGSPLPHLIAQRSAKSKTLHKCALHSVRV